MKNFIVKFILWVVIGIIAFYAIEIAAAICMDKFSEYKKGLYNQGYESGYERGYKDGYDEDLERRTNTIIALEKAIRILQDEVKINSESKEPPEINYKPAEEEGVAEETHPESE